LTGSDPHPKFDNCTQNASANPSKIKNKAQNNNIWAKFKDNRFYIFYMNLHRKKKISCAGKMEDSKYFAMLAQWLFARLANIFASMANIFAGTAQYLLAWLNISRHSTIFASMSNIISGTAQY
jgi:hypothetical protein